MENERVRFRLIGETIAGAMLSPARAFSVGFFMGIGFLCAAAVPLFVIGCVVGLG